MIKQKFVYEAKVLDVHDGDTITVEIDLGFNMKFTDKIRLYGLNAPELKIKNEAKKMVENVSGSQARDILQSLLPIGSTIVVETVKDKKEKFGRYLGNVYVVKGEEQIFINEYLLKNGYAKKMVY